MKLQILVPQYLESEEVFKPLLDSIAIQQNIDMNEIGMIICNDGTNIKLSQDFLNQYPFKIEYYFCPRRGVSATRNSCLQYATADYVMFCDDDDMFYSVCALWYIFEAMKENFDIFDCTFIEEVHDTETNSGLIIYSPHIRDRDGLHGKAYRRQYLIDNDIKFNETINLHEDSYFNTLAYLFTTNIYHYDEPLYLWKWRDDSTCRLHPKFYMTTYDTLIWGHEALYNELRKRGMGVHATACLLFIIYDTYYLFHNTEWAMPQNKQYLDHAATAFKEWFQQYREFWQQADKDSLKTIYTAAYPDREIDINDLNQWLNSL